jgi:hypothetical protein
MSDSNEHRYVASRRDSPWLRLAAALVVALAVWLAVPGAARAEWSVIRDTVPKGQVIDNDVLVTGTDVSIDGTINGDLLAAGTTVTVNGPVSGSLVAAGQTVALNGEVGGSTYVAGRTLKLGETARVQNNVHFLGLLLEGQRGSRVGRDLVAASIRARVSSEVGRALRALVLLLNFDGRIGAGSDQPGAVGLSLGGPLLGPGGDLLGVALASGGGYRAYFAPTLSTLVAGLGPMAPAQQEEGASGGTWAGISEWLRARLSDLLILLLVGGLVIWLRPALIRRPAEGLRRRPLPALGFGLLAAVLSILALIVAVLLAVLFLVGGIWLGANSLWLLAAFLWGLGFPALLLAVALLAVTVQYGSFVIVADLVGGLILKRLAPGVMKHRILPLLLGLVLYVLLRGIPVFGWALEVVVTLLGLGAIWIALRKGRLPEAVEVEEQAEYLEPVLPTPVPEA